MFEKTLFFLLNSLFYYYRMAIEDEFGFEITEDQVDKLVTPGKIVEYVCAHEGI